MAQLVNFIPATREACRNLLRELQGQTSFALADRYGNTRTLGKDEIAELTRLVESQIGEKAPLRKKQTKKTAKK